jgi:hypothetical protein
MTFDEITAAFAAMERDTQERLLLELHRIVGCHPALTLDAETFVAAVDAGRWVDEGLIPGSVGLAQAKPWIERVAREAEFPEWDQDELYELVVEGIVAQGEERVRL